MSLLRKNILFVVFCAVLLLADYAYCGSAAYDHILNQAKEKYEDKDYSLALEYFQVAQSIEPSETEAQNYINLIIRESSDSLVGSVESTSTSVAVSTKPIATNRLDSVLVSPDRQKAISFLNNYVTTKQETKKASPKLETSAKSETISTKEPIVFKDTRKKGDKKVPLKGKKLRAIDLKRADRNDFPVNIEISPGQVFLVRSETLKRFMSTNDSKVFVSKEDAMTLKVRAKDYGTTFVHVWDANGRWTFNITVKNIRPRKVQERKWVESKGFTFIYNVDWGSFGTGRRVDELHKEGYAFDESLLIEGPTPYGEFDMNMTWSRSDGHDDLIGVSAGLSEGKFLFLKDFKFRLYDVSAGLSSYSLPGASLKGFMFDTPIFDKKMEYKLIYGRERDSVYGDLTPGISGEKDEFIEGAQVGYHHDENNSYYFSMAKGYGDDRAEYLKSKAFALKTKHKGSDWTVNTESGTDEDKVAMNIRANLEMERSSLGLYAFNVEPDYTTVTGRASRDGEQGGRISYNFRPNNDWNYYTGMELYRDRVNYNAEYQHRPNVNWSGRVSRAINRTSNASFNLNYVNTQNSVYPLRSYNANASYSKRFDLSHIKLRTLSTNYNYAYSRSIYPMSIVSNNQRNSLFAGANIALSADWSYFLNFRYSFVNELHTNQSYKPRVMRTGLSYRHNFGRKLRTYAKVNYRNEEKAEGKYSSLSGNDSIEFSSGITYKPVRGTELFVDGSVKNYWAEKEGASKYVQGDIHLGARVTWDSFIRWAPATTVKGFVFKDTNANGVKDVGEPGIKDVKVFVGPTDAVSKESGEFTAKVRAEKVVANVDVSTIPNGYVFTGVSAVEVETAGGGTREIAFGLNPKSGITGVVFYDINNNNKLDRSDIPLSSIKIKLDGKKIAVTNNQGVYFFPDAVSGRHTVLLDISSLPVEYIPKVRLKQEVEVTEGLTYMHYIPLGKKK